MTIGKDKKRYLIHCDLEGVSGIVNYDQVNPSKPLYEQGRKIFNEELLSLVKGLHESGADEIYAYDHHYFGTNIDIFKMPRYVKIICGKPLYKYNWIGNKDESFTGVILLGLHSKAGTPDGLLAHSYEHDIKDIRINNCSVGEIGMEAAIAGDFGTPLILITGDSNGVEEAGEMIKNIESVTVKRSLSKTGAICYPLEYTISKIYNAAKKIVKNPPDVDPVKFEPPVLLEVELYNTDFLDKMRKKFGDCFEKNSNVIKIIKNSVLDAWSDYILKKLSVI